MAYRIVADLVLVVHLGFILFALFGALLCLRSPWFAALHLPAAVWAAVIEITGQICPLTLWENAARRMAGEAGYSESFVDRYLLPVIYPAGLDQNLQFTLAAIVVVLNVALYVFVWRRRQSSP